MTRPGDQARPRLAAALKFAAVAESKCSLGRLTVKLRGRPEAPDWSRGCTLSFRTRGDTTDSHGPLQRLLGDNVGGLDDLGFLPIPRQGFLRTRRVFGVSVLSH